MFHPQGTFEMTKHPPDVLSIHTLAPKHATLKTVEVDG